MCKLAYVVKRYPRFSETFILNELLAHEAAGIDIEVFSLRPPVDTHFQDLISLVRAPVSYLSVGKVSASELWQTIGEAHRECPQVLQRLGELAGEDSLDVYCGLKLAIAGLQRGIGHLHAHFATSAACVVRIASILSEIPYSVTAHAKDIFHESVVHEDLEKRVADSRVTFTVSDFNLEHLTSRFGATASSKLVRLYNGMHLEQFPYHCPQHRPPMIIAVGRFVEKKGFSDLIDACAILDSRQITFSCCLVGSGELMPELQAQICRLNLEHCVTLLGPQPQRVVKQLVAESAVMVAPCINGSDGNRDGLPTVLLESMALGTPCISTDVTGIPEVIRDGRTGLLVGQHNPAALAEALIRLLNDGGLRAALAQEARKLIVREFDISRNAALQRKHLGLVIEKPVPSFTPSRQLVEV